MKLYDISLTITPNIPHFLGKVAPRRDILRDMADGALANCSAICLDCHVGTHVDAPRHFVRNGETIELETLLVGIDAFSVDRYGSDEPSHHIILPAGIPFLECVDLTDAPLEEYELIDLPLKIAGSEGAPARAILRQR